MSEKEPILEGTSTDLALGPGKPQKEAWAAEG